MNQKDALIIFIKNPQLGKVKTRLAKSVGDESALEIYKKLLKYTQHIALSMEAERYVFYSDFVDLEDDWLPLHFHKFLQKGGDLGERMYNAFQEVLQKHQKAIIIGSDCPTLTKEIIYQGFYYLTHNDITIGPAKDGGYYLLGMKAQKSFLFENIAWSTENVFSETIKRLQQYQCTFTLLQTLSDLDTEADWIALQDNINF